MFQSPNALTNLEVAWLQVLPDLGRIILRADGLQFIPVLLPIPGEDTCVLQKRCIVLVDVLVTEALRVCCFVGAGHHVLRGGKDSRIVRDIGP
jgi:hypothetical protein